MRIRTLSRSELDAHTARTELAYTVRDEVFGETGEDAYRV